RGEAAQVEEHISDLAPMRQEQLLALCEDRIGHRWCEEALETCEARELVHLRPHPRLEARVELGQLARVALHLVLQCLDAQQRFHAREELGLVDRLAEEVVRTGLDAL